MSGRAAISHLISTQECITIVFGPICVIVRPRVIIPQPRFSCSGGWRWGKPRSPRPFHACLLRFVEDGILIDDVEQTNGESLLLSAASTIQSKRLLRDVFHNGRACAWREPRRAQHA